jgi:hypothetical protein
MFGSFLAVIPKSCLNFSIVSSVGALNSGFNIFTGV